MEFLWQKLHRPFFCLAPMEGVTDSAFRRVIIKIGKPDVMFTEFTSADGLLSKGEKYVSKRLVYFPEEQPLIAQIWGTKPDNFYKTAQLLKTKGFSGIDINIGCPDRQVVKKGGGAALIGNEQLVGEIIRATVAGADGLPVSVKTRLGLLNIETEKWISFLLKQPLAAITLHGRTAAEKSDVPAHWDEIGLAVRLRNRSVGAYCNTPLQKPLIIGNGDVLNLTQAREKINIYNVDGVMIGRGVLHNPWVFNQNGDAIKTKNQKVDLLEYHLQLFHDTWGDTKKFVEMRKYFKIYIKGFPGAAHLLDQMMRATTSGELHELLKN